MSRLQFILMLSPLLLPACGTDPLPSDCGGMCEPFGDLYPEMGICRDGECTPKFGDCFSRDEFETCEAACGAQGLRCAENSCAEGTYMVIGSLDFCQDPSKEGVVRASSCDVPIDWQVTIAGRCCCEQQ